MLVLPPLFLQFPSLEKHRTLCSSLPMLPPPIQHLYSAFPSWLLSPGMCWHETPFPPPQPREHCLRATTAGRECQLCTVELHACPACLRTAAENTRKDLFGTILCCAWLRDVKKKKKNLHFFLFIGSYCTSALNSETSNCFLSQKYCICCYTHTPLFFFPFQFWKQSCNTQTLCGKMK